MLHQHIVNKEDDKKGSLITCKACLLANPFCKCASIQLLINPQIEIMEEKRELSTIGIN